MVRKQVAPEPPADWLPARTDDLAPEVADFLDMIAAAGTAGEEGDSKAAAFDIMSRILTGATADEVLSPADAVTHARDFLDVPFVIESFKLNPSTMNGEGPPAYAIMSGHTDDGSPVTVSCGSVNVMAQLHRLQRIGGLPAEVKIVEGNPTAAGFRPLWLRAGDAF